MDPNHILIFVPSNQRNVIVKLEPYVKCQVNEKRSYVYSAAYYLYLNHLVMNFFIVTRKMSDRVSPKVVNFFALFS